MSLIKWEPSKNIDTIFESLPTFMHTGGDLAIDLYEKDNNVIAEMHLPGIDPDKIDITVENEYLCISGSREEMEEKIKKQYYSKEIRRGTFERIVHLPSKVKEDEVSAEFKNGELIVTLPKAVGSATKKVRVAVKK